MTVSASNGESHDYDLTQGGNWINPSFTTSYFNDNVMTFSVVVNDELLYSYSIDVVRVTSVLAYAGDTPTEAVAVGQRADFRAVLNTYAGHSADWAPGCLGFDNATLYAYTSWAHNTWTEPGEPTVVATLGNTSADRSIYVVKATIRSVTFTGDGFANILRDTDGTAYPTPHYSHAQPNDASPVQYRRNARPTMNLVFDVEPVTYPGIVKIQAASNLETSVAHNNACAGDLYLNSVQTTGLLPDSIGHEDLEMNWDFSVAADSFYPAGTSTHRIYRTLNEPSARYHTCVYIACFGKTGTDETNIFNQIWAEFASRSVRTFDNIPLTYYASTQFPANYNQSTAFLLQHHDGMCNNWMNFLIDCLAVHQFNTLQVTGMYIKPLSSLYRPPGYLLYLDVLGELDGQNTSPPSATWFNYHAIVLKGSSIYDPSYGIMEDAGTGNLQDSLRQLENNSLRSVFYALFDSLGNVIPGTVKNYWPNQSTNITELSVNP